MYENVYNEQIKNDCRGTAAMHGMIDQADVVIEEQIDRTCIITKPAEGYNGIVATPCAQQFAVDHPEASVLFIQYAGGFTRYNLKNEAEVEVPTDEVVEPEVTEPEVTEPDPDAGTETE